MSKDHANERCKDNGLVLASNDADKAPKWHQIGISVDFKTASFESFYDSKKPACIQCRNFDIKKLKKIASLDLEIDPEFHYPLFF